MTPGTISFLKAVLEATWQGSLVILLVLLVRPLLGFRVPARWRSFLWMLVLVRLLVPAFVLPRSPASLQNIAVVQQPITHAQISLDQAYADYVNAREMRRRNAGPSNPVELPSMPLTESPRHRMPWWEIAALTWLSGAVLCAVWIMIATIRLHLRLRRETGMVDAAVVSVWKSCCARFSFKHPPRLVVTPLVGSPALLGVWRPALLIPGERARVFSEEDWEHIFMHELAHFRRRDHWMQMLQLLALCVHWFNPLVWVGFRFLRADRELATDELALKHLTGDRAAAYGATLLKVLSGRASIALQPGLVGIMEDAAQLKQRLRRIVAFGPRKTLGSAMGLGITFILAALVLGKEMNKADMSNYIDMKPADIIVTAASKGDLPAVKKMLDDGTPINISSDALGEPRTALVAGSGANQMEIVKFLVTKGAQLNPEKDEPSPPLIAALRNGWLDCADYLVKKGANSDPLAMAAAKGNEPGIDKALAKNGRDFEQMKIACEIAAVNGQTAIFTKLYDAIRLLTGHLDWVPDRSIVVTTIARGHKDVVEQMLDRDDMLLYGQVIRFGAVAAQTSGMREWLVSKGLQVPEYTDNERLIDASARQDLAEMERLIKAGAKVNYTGESGWTPITIAAAAGRLKAVKLLLAHGANPNSVKDCFNLSALCLAKTPEIADALLAAGANINATYLGRHIIDYCVTFGPKEMVQWFIDHGVDPAKAKCDEPTLLFDVHDPGIAEILIQHGVDVNAREVDPGTLIAVGQTALHRVGYRIDERELPAAQVAIAGKPAELARVLLKHGADPNARDKGGVTPLMLAADGATVDVLVEFGADLKARSNDGLGVIDWSGQIADVGRLEALVRHGVPFDVKTDGPAMLVRAAGQPQERTRLDFMEYLLKQGVDPNAPAVRDQDQRTPLMAALWARKTDSANLLLEHGAKVVGPLKELDNADLWTLVIRGRMPEFARLFWEHGFRGVSGLTYAISQDEPIGEIRKLLDQGMPADPPQDVTISPLAQAAELGNLEAVKLLVERKANLDGVNPRIGPRWSPLGLAVDRGQDEIVDYLLKQGTRIDYQNVFDALLFSNPNSDERGKEHFERTVKLLIDDGGVAGLTEQQIVKLYLFAILSSRNPVVVKMLLDAPLDINSRDKDGKSVLQNASDSWKAHPDRKPSPEMLAILKPADKDNVLK